MARAVSGRESLGQVAALTQGNAVLEAGATFRCALKREGKGVRRRSGQHSEPERTVSLRISYLRPVQSDPLWRTGLVVARLLFDRSVSQTVGVLQCLLLSRADLPDAQDCPRPDPAIARLPTLRPVANKPPGGEKQNSFVHKNQS